MKYLALILAIAIGACSRTGTQEQKPNKLHVYHSQQPPTEEEIEESLKIIWPRRIETKEVFQKVLSGKMPGVNNGAVVIAFEADWCPSCKKLWPNLVRLQTAHPDITVLTVDIDQLKDVTEENEVVLVPTMILFRNGRRVGSLAGYYDVDVLERFIQSDYL